MNTTRESIRILGSSVSIMRIGCYVALLLVFPAIPLRGDDKLVVLIPKDQVNADVPARTCSSPAAIKYELVRNLRINGKKDIQFLTGHLDAESGTTIAKHDYDHAAKINLNELSAIEIRNNVLYIVRSDNQPLVGMPQGVKVKTASTDLSALYTVSIEGEVPAGKKSAKFSRPLKEVWKIFFIKNPDDVPEALFQHASEESSVGLWKAYLSMAQGHKLQDTLSALAGVLSQCVSTSLDQYRGGSYASLGTAKDAALELKGIADDASSGALLASVTNEENTLASIVQRTKDSVSNEHWDDAIATAEPIVKYLDALPEVKSLYGTAVDKSFALHMQQAHAQESSNHFKEAVDEFAIASKRKPESPEAAESGDRVSMHWAILDSAKLRKAANPGKARERLSNVRSNLKGQALPEFRNEWHSVNCELGGQLVAKSKKTFFNLKTHSYRHIATAADADRYDEQLQLLRAVADECHGQAIDDVVTHLDGELAGFQLISAKRAQANKHYGVALLHANAAARYIPERADIKALQVSTKEALRQALKPGVVFTVQRSKTNADCAALESQLNSAVAPDLAAYFTTASLASNEAISLTAVIDSCTIRRVNATQTVASKYRVDNTTRQDLQQKVDAANNAYKACRSSHPEAQCADSHTNLNNLQAALNNTPESILYDYQYTVDTLTVAGAPSVEVNVVGPYASPRGVKVSRKVADVCVTPHGKRDDDASSGLNVLNFAAIISTAIAQNSGGSQCYTEDTPYFSTVVSDAQQAARSLVQAHLDSLPDYYYTRASTDTDHETQAEDYIRSLLLRPVSLDDSATKAHDALANLDKSIDIEGVSLD